MLLEHLLSSRGSGPPLRIALLLDGHSLARHCALVVDHIQRSDFARVELLVLRKRRPAEPLPLNVRLARRLADPRQRSRLLFELYERWDRWRTTTTSDPLGPVDLSEQLRGIPAIEVQPMVEGFTHRFPAEAIARIREASIDVALRFGFNILRGDILGAARHGIWSYHHGDNEYYRGGPAHFWEMAEGNRLSGVLLQVLNEQLDDGTVLCKGLANTCSEYSLNRNRVKPYLLGSTFVIRKLKELHERGPASLRRNAVNPAPYKGKRRLYRAPSNWETAKFLIPILLRKARERVLKRPKLVHWRVAVRVNGSRRFEPGGSFEMRGFRPIQAPRGRLYADPSLIERGGQVYCFFEDLDHAEHKGRISCAVVDDAGTFRDVRPVLERPYHLSYPFVFEDGGEVFMVPESSQNKTVDLYRAIEFPGRWEKVRTLLEGPGLDTTVLRYQGRYWFFVAVREPEEAGEQLLLFHADSLTGDLTFHPLNPISADVRYCRPAGAILTQDDCLLRPSQDGSLTYGHQLHFLAIAKLTPDDYREELLVTVPPWGGMEGTHTYNRCGPVEVVDGKRMEPVARHLPGHPAGKARE